MVNGNLAFGQYKHKLLAANGLTLSFNFDLNPLFNSFILKRSSIEIGGSTCLSLEDLSFLVL